MTIPELRASRDVADGEDPAVAGQKARVDRDPLRREGDTGRVEAEALDVRAPARRDEQVAARDAPSDRAVAIERDRHDRAVAPDFADADLLQQRHAVPEERGADDLDGLRLIPGEDAELLDHRHPRTQATEGLRHLDPDGSATDDDEMLGTRRHLEDALIGEITGVRQAGDRRNGGARAGCDHEAARRDPYPGRGSALPP